MTGPERTQLSGWDREEDARPWWQRGRDPIGRHTLIAAVLGVLAAALIGALLDPLSLSTADDLAAAEQRSWQTAYDRVYDDAFNDGIPEGRADWIATQLVDDTSDSPWAESFRAGWSEGWTDAIAALRAAAQDAGLPPGHTEYRVLDALPPTPP